jgi:hypothetical protein
MAENTIREQMAALRIRSAGSATQLGSAVARMKDWREHVRAHPWLAGGAAMLAAYTLVPNRNGGGSAPNIHNGMPGPTSLAASVAGSAVPANSWMKGLTRMATHFAIGLAVKAVRDRMNGWTTSQEPQDANPTLPLDRPARDHPDWFS